MENGLTASDVALMQKIQAMDGIVHSCGFSHY